ncbi:MAG: hypothetical protein ACXABG_00040 [Promethearchaeota archaeon]|jgi:hypothetical protein
MSIYTSKSKHQDYSYFLDSDLSDIIISFEEMFYQFKAIDIYSGNENIPFLERDEEFKKILLSEFTM